VIPLMGSQMTKIVPQSHIHVDVCATIQDFFRRTHDYSAKKFCTAVKTMKWNLKLSKDPAKFSAVH